MTSRRRGASRPDLQPILGFAVLAAAFAGAACGGKKGSGSAFGPKTAVVDPAPAGPPSPPAPPAGPAIDTSGKPLLTEKQVRQLTSIVGRTVAGYGTSNKTTPLEGVRLYGYVDKKIVESSSDKDGFFFFKDVPVMSESGDNPSGNNFTIYVEKAGWELNDTTAGTATQHLNDNSFAVQVNTSPESPSAYQIDVGPVVMREQLLKVTTSLHHASRSELSSWLISGDTTPSGFNSEIYSADPQASITLTFNRPIDIAYSDNRAANALIEFYTPAGAPVPFTGTWDATKTIFTIDPTADLTPDNDDDTNYRIVIARPVRAFFADSKAVYELKDVIINFNVFPPTAGDLLASQAPGLFPQFEDKTGYIFDSAQIYKRSLQAGTTVEDFTDRGTNTFHIKWSKVANTKGYNVWWRNVAEQKDGRWTKHNGSLITPFSDGQAHPDGTISYQITNLYSSLAGTDQKLIAGEQVQFVVTAVDNDNSESSINSVATPLTISDTGALGYAPTLASATNPAHTLSVARPEAFGPQVTRSLTVNFTEFMDTAAADQAPVLTNVSGMVTALAGANPIWLSRSQWKSDVAITFTRPATTLARPAFSGDDEIFVNGSVATFRFAADDVILIKSTNNDDVDNWTEATIKHIDTQDDGTGARIELDAALGVDFPNASPVSLLTAEDIPGLTSIETKVNGNHLSGVSTIAITANGGFQFHKDQVIKFVIPDEEGFTSVGSGTIKVVSASSLELTAEIDFDIPSGATVVDNSVSASEPTPRASQDFTIVNPNPLFIDHSSDQAVVANNFVGAPDGSTSTVIVSDITKFAPNDVVVIEKSVNDKDTTAVMTANTSIPLTAHGFLEGDQILIEGEYVFMGLATRADSNPTALTLENNLALVNGEGIEIFDPDFRTTLAEATTASDTTLVVASAAGFAIGQTIVIDDGVQQDSATITAISGTTITIGSATSATYLYPVGTKAFRNEIGPTAGTINGSSTGTSVTLGAGIGSFSANAVLSANRPSDKRTVGVIADPNIIVITAGASRLRRSGTRVSLYSYDETRQITSVDQDRSEITFASALEYSHRAATRVRKARHDWLKVTPGDWTGNDKLEERVMIGDTIVVNTLGVGTAYAHADRVFATVTAIDGPRQRVRIAINKDGVTFTSSASFTHLGDAATVTIVPDANGNKIQEAHSNRVNLNNGDIR